jgi:transcriptional regulator with XRE-family HTH domain
MGDEPMDIYDRINAMLKRRSMTRKGLCDAAGISYSTLTSLFQRRSRNMRLETIRAIAEKLGVTVDYLVLGRESDVPVLAESEGPEYGASGYDEKTEILRVVSALSKRSRTILLAKAYELQEKEQQTANRSEE